MSCVDQSHWAQKLIGPGKIGACVYMHFLTEMHSAY